MGIVIWIMTQSTFLIKSWKRLKVHVAFCGNRSQSYGALLLYGIAQYSAWRDGRLSWTGWVVIHRDSLPVHRQSAVQVVTGRRDAQKTTPSHHVTDYHQCHLPGILSACIMHMLNRWQLCHSPLTVKHILIDCICFGAARQRYLRVDTLKELFENVESRSIVDTYLYQCTDTLVQYSTLSVDTYL